MYKRQEDGGDTPEDLDENWVSTRMTKTADENGTVSVSYTHLIQIQKFTLLRVGKVINSGEILEYGFLQKLLNLATVQGLSLIHILFWHKYAKIPRHTSQNLFQMLVTLFSFDKIGMLC